jgi:phosphocarrier protein
MTLAFSPPSGYIGWFPEDERDFMIERTATVLNKAGIHCRPSSAILMATMPYGEDHEMKVLSERGESGLKSILELLALGLQCGDKVTIQVEGPKELELADKLVELFSREFDFPAKAG